ILVRILSHVERPADVRSFCRTSQDTRALAADPLLSSEWLAIHRPQNALLLAANNAGGAAAMLYLLKVSSASGYPVNVNCVYTRPGCIAGYPGDTPLHIAAEEANVEAVQMLLQHGAQCKVRNSSGLTPLYTACCSRDKAAARAEIVQVLLEADCSVIDVQRKSGNTPLVHAGLNDLPECCEVLLRAGSKALTIPQSHYKESTPLHKLGYFSHRVRSVLQHYASKLPLAY
ncbi:ankyrin repeat-containing domain protein, partial [Dunaliella salina]